MPYKDPAKRTQFYREYRQKNAEKARLRAALWRVQNPERTKAVNEKWNQLRAKPRLPKTPEQRLEAHRAYHREYKRKAYAKNPTIHQKAASTSKRKNRATYTALQTKRKAQQKNAIPAWANLDVIQKLYKQAALLKKTVDHIVPLQSSIVCGLHCESNLQLLTDKENSSKGNRFWPDMW